MRLFSIVGTRPEFIQSSTIHHAAKDFDDVSRQSIYRSREYDAGSTKPELYIEYTSPPPNETPVNDSCTIIDMDDSNNLYAQISGGYSIDYDGHDDDGYVDIDYVLVNITQGATVKVSFKYDNSLDEFSIIDGSSEFTLDGSSSSSRAGNNINYTQLFTDSLDKSGLS